MTENKKINALAQIAATLAYAPSNGHQEFKKQKQKLSNEFLISAQQQNYDIMKDAQKRLKNLSQNQSKFKNSKNCINKQKDAISKQNPHLELQKYQVISSNQDMFAMKNSDDKIIYVGLAGTRPSTNLVRDFANNINIALKPESGTRLKTVNSFITKIASDNPDCKVIICGHSLGGHLAQYSTTILNEKFPQRIKGVSFNSANVKPIFFAWGTKQQYNKVTDNPNITRHQITGDVFSLCKVPYIDIDYDIGWNRFKININIKTPTANFIKGNLFDHGLHNFDNMRKIELAEDNKRSSYFSQNNYLNSLYNFGINSYNSENYWRNSSYEKISSIFQNKYSSFNYLYPELKQKDFYSTLFSKIQNTPSIQSIKAALSYCINSYSCNYYDFISQLEGYSPISQSDFRALVRSQLLTGSYNAYNLDKFLSAGILTLSDIGGVASKPGIIKSLINSTYELSLEDLLCIQTEGKQIPFSDMELQQVMRELAIGIYYYKTNPFFSLHFNNNSSLYPVIHPAYQNTLVGEVISFLDYYMKGFLNGGVFSKEFLDKWHLKPTNKREDLRPYILDIKKYCKDKNIDIQYKSLRQMLAEQGIQDDEPADDSIYKTKFRTSFRIIGQVKEFQRYENMFAIKSDFNVEYSVQLMPDYKEELEKYQLENGTQPLKYLKMINVYRTMAQRIKNDMPKLDFCKKYFEMFKIITFISSYYMTLIEMSSKPFLPPIKKSNFQIPTQFPPIPVRYFSVHKIQIKLHNLSKIITENCKKNNIPNAFNNWIQSIFETGNTIFTNQLEKIVRISIKTIIQTQVVLQINEQINENYLSNTLERFRLTMAKIISFFQVRITSELEAINKSIENAKINIEQIQKISLIQQKFGKIFNKLNKVGKGVQSLISQQIEKQKLQAQKAINQKITKQKSEQDEQKNKNKADLMQQFQSKKVEIQKQMEEKLVQAQKKLNQQAAEIFSSQLAKVPVIERSLIQSQMDKLKTQLDTQTITNLRKYKKKLAIDVGNIKNQLTNNKNKGLVQLQNLYNKNIGIINDNAAAQRSSLKNFCVKQKQKRITESKQVLKKLQTLFNEMKQSLICYSQTLIKIADLNINIADAKYKQSRICIADCSYYKQLGQNFRIVGGCGLRMPNIQINSLPFGNQNYLKISLKMTQQPTEKPVLHTIGNSNFIVFKINHFKDQYCTFSNQICLSFLTPYNQMGQNQLEYLSNCSTTSVLPQCNFESKDKFGRSIAHHLVIATNSSESMQALYSKHQNLFELKDQFGNLPIHLAASFGSEQSINFLLQKNPKNLEAVNYKLYTPLISAVLSQNMRGVKTLLNNKANSNYELPNGLNPVLIAIQNGFLRIAQQIVRHASTNVNATRSNGQTYLFTSINQGFNTISLLILPKYQLFDIKSKVTGFTVLHLAVKLSNYEMVKEILKTKKISVDIKIDSGMTSLHLAAAQNDLHIVKLLIEEFKATVDAKNNTGKTPLMCAIESNSIDTSHYLSNIAKINELNSQSKTCADIAVMNNMTKISETLINRGQKLTVSNQTEENFQKYLVSYGSIVRFQKQSKTYKITQNQIKNIAIKLLKQKNFGFILNHIIKSNLVKNIYDLDIEGKKLIHFAIQADEVGTVRKWIQKNQYDKGTIIQGPEKGKTLMYIACQAGSSKVLSILIERYGKQHLLKGNINFHILKAAIISGNEIIINIVVKYFDQINIQIDPDGSTCAHFIARLGHIKLVPFFEKKGLNFIKHNKAKQSALAIAIASNDQEMVSKLIQLVQVDKWNEEDFKKIFEKQKCLDVVSKIKSFEKIKLHPESIFKAIQTNITHLQDYLRKGFDVNVAYNNELPLAKAIRKGNADIVNLLLQHKADPFKKEGVLDCFDIAINLKRIQCIKVLLKHRKFSNHMINLYRKKTTNYFVKKALTGNFADFEERANKLISSTKSYHIKLFQECIQDFPLDQLICIKGETKKPLLFYLFEYGFEAGIKLICKQVNPLMEDENHFKLGFIVLKSEDKQIIGYLHKYFQENQKEILKEKFKGETLLVLAVKFGKIEFSKFMIKKYESLCYIIDQNGNTVLHDIVKSQSIQILKEALQNHKGNIDYRNNRKVTPLMLACKLQNCKIVKLLLDKGANPNLVDIQGKNSLLFTFQNQKPNQIVQLLFPLIHNINSQRRDNTTSLMMSVSKSNLSVIKIILSKYPKIHQRNNYGWQAVHFFAKYGSIIQMKILLDAGADINSQIVQIQSQKTSQSLNTPLHIAALSGNFSMFVYLYNNGANTSLKNSLEMTPIQTAIMNKRPQIMRTIVQFPYLYNRDNEQSLLRACCLADNPSVLQMLIQKDFNINVIGKNSRVPLHWAAIKGAKQSISILLQCNANINAKDDQFKTPLHYTVQSSNVTSTEILLKHGADLEIVEKADGASPLHIACKKGNLAIISLLVLYGSNIKLNNKKGLTPAQIALIEGHIKVVELLIVFGDKSLQQNALQKLSEFYKKKIFGQYSDFVTKFQAIIKNQQNFLETAIVLRNLEALKLHLSMRPDYFPDIDKLIILCKKNSYFDEERILSLHEFNMKNQKRKSVILSIVIKKQNQQRQQSKNIKKASFLKINAPLSSFQILLEILKQHKIDPSKFKHLNNLANFKAIQLKLFSEGIYKEKNKETYINDWTEILFKYGNHSFRSTFLAFLPWNIFPTKYLSELVLLIHSTQTNPIIIQWFYKYFQPLLINVINIQKLVKQALMRFKEFVLIINKSKVKISKPTTKCISYLFQNNDFIENCLYVLKKSKFLPIQISNLCYLPGIHVIKQQQRLKICVFFDFFNLNRAIKTKQQLVMQNQYLDLQMDFLNYAIMKTPQNAVICHKIIKFIRQLSLNNQSKTALLARFIQSINQTKQFVLSQVFHYFIMGNRVRTYVGIQIFSEIFIKSQLNQKCELSQYIKICEFCIFIKNVDIIKQAVTKSKYIIKQMKKQLEVVYAKQMNDKFPESSIEEIQKGFKQLSEFVKKPIDDLQLKQIIKNYQIIKQIGQVVKNKSMFEITTECLKLGKQLRLKKENIQLQNNILALLRELMFRQYRIYPYCTQIMAILGLINYPSSKLKGRIAQIGTGEGKSTISTILTAFYAVQGYCVDIITTSRYLAIRDQQKYKQFYKVLQVTSSHICEDNPKKQAFDGQILFGTNYDFEFSILRDQFYKMDLRYTTIEGKLQKRKCQIAVVDEADSLFLDLSLNSARMSIASPVYTSWVYEIIYKEVEENMKNKTQPKIQKITKLLQNFIKKPIQFDKKTLQKWIQSAKKAYNFQQNVDYVINYSNQTNSRQIIIVDHKNTGRLNLGSRWSYGIHQFVEVKNNIQPKDQSYTAASISHPAFFKQYQIIFGITGTIGSNCENQQVKSIYNLDSFDVPRHFPNKRIKQSIILTNQQTHYQSILKQILEYKKKLRPVLLIFLSILQTEQFSKYMLSKGHQHQVLNERQKEDENIIIQRAGNIGAITVATNTAGRGTDICLDPQALKNGGLHTIFTFYPTNSRVEDQGFGRSGRQGQNGSCQIIIHKKDLQFLNLTKNSTFNFEKQSRQGIEKELYTLRENRTELLSQQRLIQSKIQTSNYQILKKYCQKLNKLRIQMSNLKSQQFVNICEKYIPKTEKKISHKIFFSQQLIIMFKNFLAIQTSGKKAPWNSLIKKVQEQIIQNSMLKWAQFFTAFIEKRTTNQAEIKQIWDQFLEERLELVAKDLKSFINQHLISLLSLAQN